MVVMKQPEESILFNTLVNRVSEDNNLLYFLINKMNEYTLQNNIEYNDGTKPQIIQSSRINPYQQTK